MSKRTTTTASQKALLAKDLCRDVVFNYRTPFKEKKVAINFIATLGIVINFTNESKNNSKKKRLVWQKMLVVFRCSMYSGVMCVSVLWLSFRIRFGPFDLNLSKTECGIPVKHFQIGDSLLLFHWNTNKYFDLLVVRVAKSWKSMHQKWHYRHHSIEWNSFGDDNNDRYGRQICALVYGCCQLRFISF